MQTVFKKIQENAESKLATLIEPLEYMGIVREEIEKFIRDTEKIGKDAQK